MKKYLLFSLVILSVFFFSKEKIFAHTVRSDGDMSVLMHADPDDDPVAGAPAQGLGFSGVRCI